MIIDRLDNAAIYRNLSKRLAQALDVLKLDELPWLDVGRHELDGDRIYAIVQHGDTKLRDQALWEAHRRYIDVQYVAEGCEVMGWRPTSSLQEPRAPYDEQKDIVFFAPDGGGSFLTVPAGTFVIFFPHDAHMPSLALTTPQPVRKVVVKIAID